jgi:hypothetical protein
MFPLEDCPDPDHKAPPTGESADPWVTGMVSGKPFLSSLILGYPDQS